MYFISDEGPKIAGSTFKPLKKKKSSSYKKEQSFAIYKDTHACMTPFLNATQNGLESSTRVALSFSPRLKLFIVMSPPASSHQRFICRIITIIISCTMNAQLKGTTCYQPVAQTHQGRR